MTADEKNNESDIVISSRIRLARNLKDFPFPLKMTRDQQENVLTVVRDSVRENESELLKNLMYLDIQTLNPLDKLALVERHLISPDLAESQRACGALISKDENISIMINEEDHLRIQCLFSGMQMEEAWTLCDKIDGILEKKLDFAFSGKYGYLTSCPTNIGTGIRASVMMHLPALTMTGYIKKILEACSKLGIAVRGLYGENSEAAGNMFQVSNQMTLGQREEEIIHNISHITSQIIEQERMLRDELYKQNHFRFEDKIYRSYGIFMNARILTTEESLQLLSDVRLGVNMGIIKDISIKTLDEITLLIQPANLQKCSGKFFAASERDVRRAELIREKLKLNN